MQVLVRDNNVDQALKALKKKMQREGIFREMKLRGHYEKPSEKKAREKAEAVRRARKLARKRAQREGLIPMKPKLVPGAPGGERGGRAARRGPWRREPQSAACRRGGGGSAAAADLAAAGRFRALRAAPFRSQSVVHGAGRSSRRPALWLFRDPALSSNVRRNPSVNSRWRDRPG